MYIFPVNKSWLVLELNSIHESWAILLTTAFCFSLFIYSWFIKNKYIQMLTTAVSDNHNYYANTPGFIMLRLYACHHTIQVCGSFTIIRWQVPDCSLKPTIQMSTNTYKTFHKTLKYLTYTVHCIQPDSHSKPLLEYREY